MTKIYKIILYNVRKNIEKNASHLWSKKRRSINEIWRVLIIFVTPFPLCFKNTFLNDQITAHLKHVSRLINKLGPKLRYQILAKIIILGNSRHKEVKFHVPLPMRMENSRLLNFEKIFYNLIVFTWHAWVMLAWPLY